MSRHVVIGAGPLGVATAQALLQRGNEVVLANRRGAVADAPEGASLQKLDALDPSAVRALCAGAESVYQCAQPAYHRWPQDFPPLQRAILTGVADAGAKFIVAENLYMYGPVVKAMTEETPMNATTRKGRTRAAMSAELMKAHQRGDVRVAIGRGSDFFGPGVVNSALGEFAFGKIVTARRAQGFGDIDTPHSYTFIKDFGAALALLGADDRAMGKIWHVPNAPTVTTRRLLEIAAQETEKDGGAKVTIGSMGRLMLYIGSLFNRGAYESLEMAYEFEKPFVVDNSRFTAAFGDIATPHETAIQETLRWYREKLRH